MIQSRPPSRREKEKMSEAKKLFTATFKAIRDTKNTVRFDEEPTDNRPPYIGPLYIQKWALRTETGEIRRVRVTVEAL